MPTYNDPAFGQAINNIAKAFMPPSGADLYAGGKNAREQKDFEARRRAIAALAPDMARAADIAPEQFVNNYGDIQLATAAAAPEATPQSLANLMLGAKMSYQNTAPGVAYTEQQANTRNAADNQARVAMKVVEPLSQNQSRGDITPILKMFGVDAGALAGPQMGIQERDPSKDYVLPGGGVISARVDNQNKPMNVVVTGPDGQTRTAITRDFKTDVAGRPLLGAGDVLTQMFGSQVQGGLSDVTGPTKANQTEANRRMAELNKTLGLIDRYETIINNPGTIGLVGDVRSTMQNLIQTGNEVGALLGSEGGQIIREIQDAARRGAETVGVQNFDPNLDAAQFARNLLAYRLAQSENPNGEVGVKAFERANQALGDNWLANQASTRARLGEFRQSLLGELRAYDTLQGRRGAPAPEQIVGSGAPPPPVATPAAPGRVRYEIRNGQLVPVGP